MQKGKTEIIKKALRRNVRHCKNLFFESENPKRRERRMVKIINNLYQLSNVKLVVYTLGIYGNVGYIYDEKTSMFIQKEETNPLFPECIPFKEFVKAINKDTLIIVNIIN